MKHQYFFCFLLMLIVSRIERAFDRKAHRASLLSLGGLFLLGGLLLLLGRGFLLLGGLLLLRGSLSLFGGLLLRSLLLLGGLFLGHFLLLFGHFLLLLGDFLLRFLLLRSGLLRDNLEGSLVLVVDRDDSSRDGGLKGTVQNRAAACLVLRRDVLGDGNTGNTLAARLSDDRFNDFL